LPIGIALSNSSTGLRRGHRGADHGIIYRSKRFLNVYFCDAAAGNRHTDAFIHFAHRIFVAELGAQ
jgi:hypothetical protein